MREIKFRGRVKYNGNHYFYGEWVTGYFLKDSKGDSFIVDMVEDEYSNVTYNKVLILPETLGQYTGLKSSTRTEEFPEGIEIYEGDIVNCSKGCPHEIVWVKEYGGTYVGGMPCWYLKGLNEGYAWSGKEELVGNIHEC